jgi:beta-glucosidase
LLVDTLRGRWGFAGHVVSDCGAIEDFHLHHKVTPNAAASAALGVRMGCDLNCGCTYHDLILAAKEGLITVAEIDTSLRRLLATRFHLGMFDPPERVPWSATPTGIIDCPAHRALARQAAVESIVLLKNAGSVLPLRCDPASLLVVGPHAASAGVLLGNYYGVAPQLVTLLEGIVERVTEGTRIEYRAGCPLDQPPASGLNYTFPTADDAEVVIAVLGLDSTLEGEEGDAVASTSGGDRAVIELPACQREFLLELRKHARKLVLILTGGSALAVPEAHELCDAIIQVWYPGCEGGRAVADVLFGAVSPSGRLPVTVPRKTSDLPPFADYHMRGRTYRFAEIEPLYPFGFGLSYARLAYGPLSVGARTLAEGQELTVRTTITNSSERAVDETAQCYLIPPRSWPDAPLATLVAFQKVPVPARGAVEVEFKLAADRFRQVNAAGERVWVPGRYGLEVGASSPGPRALELGAPAPAMAEIDIVSSGPGEGRRSQTAPAP